MVRAKNEAVNEDGSRHYGEDFYRAMGDLPDDEKTRNLIDIASQFPAG